MRTYDRQFKEEAIKLSDEIGIGKAAEQLGVPYYTLADWRSALKHHGEQASVVCRRQHDKGTVGPRKGGIPAVLHAHLDHA